MRTLITNIGQLVTPQGVCALRGPAMTELLVVPDAEVLVEDGRIKAVKQRLTGGRVMGGKADSVVDMGQSVVLPGLIDAHCHASNRSDRVRNEGVDRVPDADRTGLSAHSLRAALVRGTVVRAVSCLWREITSRSCQDRPKSGADMVIEVLLEPETMDSGSRGTAVERLIAEAIPTMRARRLARFCAVACGSRSFSAQEAKMVLRAAKGAGLSIRIHAEAHRAENLGRMACDAGAVAIEDASFLNEVDVQALRGSEVVAVLLPGRTFLSDDRPTNARMLIDAGLAVAIGTDGCLMGSGMQSMWLALSAGVRRNGLTLPEGIAAVTLNAAASIECGETCGTIEVGKRANLVALDLADYRDLAAYVDAVPVRSVVQDGRLVDSL